MRRTYLFVSLTALIGLVVCLLAIPNCLTALSGKEKPAQPEPTRAHEAKNPVDDKNPTPTPSLPITQVSLFTSGVAFFQREAKVEENAVIDLSFPVNDINDLLKSLVLQDLDGGQINTVAYDSQDPIDKALQGYVIDLSANPSYAEILNQARGEKVEVNWFPTDARLSNTIVGTIVGIESRPYPVKHGGSIEKKCLNLWVDGAIQCIQLSEITKVHFLNPLINSEVSQALEVVAKSRDVQEKTVRFHFTGKGERKVLIGYIAEHPVWKTSYRLVLDDKKQPLLQGWAIVENPTNEDWKDVRVCLFSGQPISFRMNLYEPLYVERPEVYLERFANLKPRVYQQEMQKMQKMQEPMEQMEQLKKQEKKAPLPFFGRKPRGEEKALKELYDREAFESTAKSVAQAGALGEQFQYAIDQPVSLPRQKSAMLPIVNSDIEGIRVSIYNEQTLATNPLHGLKLKNITGLHLMQGPITVFDEGGYAGDALIDDLQPGEERLISYAIDLGTEVKAEAKSDSQNVTELVIIKGIAHKTIVERQTKTYQIKNNSNKDRLVIIEHPDRSPTYDLIKPEEKPSRSRDYYRFEVTVPAGESKSFPVVEQRQIVQEYQLTNTNSQTMALLIKSSVASSELKKALQKAIDLKNQVAETQKKISDLREKLDSIGKEQERQRNNMKVIPQTEPVYKKYLEKFLKQEEEIDSIRAQIEELQVTANEQRQAYESYLMNLSVKKESKDEKEAE